MQYTKATLAGIVTAIAAVAYGVYRFRNTATDDEPVSA